MGCRRYQVLLLCHDVSHCSDRCVKYVVVQKLHKHSKYILVQLHGVIGKDENDHVRAYLLVLAASCRSS